LRNGGPPNGELVLCIGPVPNLGRFRADPVRPRDWFNSSATLFLSTLSVGTLSLSFSGVDIFSNVSSINLAVVLIASVGGALVSSALFDPLELLLPLPPL